MWSRKSLTRGGFTLVEILTVLVIIGIASAVVVPQLGTRDDIKVAAAARTLTADLIYAQNLAISQQKYIYIRFDTTNNNYKVLSVANSSGDTVMSHPITQLSYVQQFGSGSKSLESVSIQSVDFDGVDSTIADEFTLAFDEMGAPYAFCYDVNNQSDLKNGVIVLKSGGFTTTVTVQPYTGEILVQ
jgi:prepilin-type N-terminal cleavage/methylation domain-containing protein